MSRNLNGQNDDGIETVNPIPPAVETSLGNFQTRRPNQRSMSTSAAQTSAGPSGYSDYFRRGGSQYQSGTQNPSNNQQNSAPHGFFVRPPSLRSSNISEGIVERVLESSANRRPHGNNRPPDNWRFSRSSVSTLQSSIYHSAQDISELISDSEFDSELSPFRSYHSIQDNLSFDQNEDVFSSPQGSPVQGRKQMPKSVAFQNVMPLRDVDYVMCWDGNQESATNDGAREKRVIFEKNLEEEGLVLERERLEAGSITFVKIHVPLEVLRRYAEILKLRMPMKELEGDLVENICDGSPEFFFQLPQLAELKERSNALISEVASWFSSLTDYFQVDPRIFPPKEDQKYTAIYSRDKEYLFNVDEQEFFTPTIRGRVIDFILRRKRFSDDTFDDFGFGIERLLKDNVYSAAYILHDGDLKSRGSCQRSILYNEWGSLTKCLKYQPLDHVKEYFGVKIGLYFAWLGFYTHMLIPASILGLICFLYGCFTLYGDTNSLDICNASQIIHEKMCPLCDKFCEYWELQDTCFYARLTYLFDNDATILFAVLMSFWTAVFLEYWKRYAAEITHRWDLTGYDISDEHPRPEYLARLKNMKRKRLNIVTNTQEPYVPFWRMKLPYTMFSLSIVLLLISLAVAAVIAVIFYRLSVLFALTQIKDPSIHSWGLILVNTTAAIINLIFIFFFNWLYSYLAEYLTEIEFHRTQTEFDESLTLKMYLLQFINYYSSIFYIAFFKGKFIGYPKKYTRIFGFRQEECAPGGCMTELCIQLAIIMVGKQAINTILEMLWPLTIKWWNQFKLMTGISDEKEAVFTTQWAKDLRLLDWGPRSLFPEYLEMVLQYGFVTIFVAAFPLAPLFALLNNILEMRLDAKKLLTYYRRPICQRVKDIGVWYSILDFIGKVAVISNAFIIAFTSNFIPKLVYQYGAYDMEGGIMNLDIRHGTLDGYLEHSLSVFNTSEFSPQNAPENATSVDFCRFQSYRNNYTFPEATRYKRTDFYWKIWMARLAFVVVFENFVAVCVILLKWLIPDIPRRLKDQINKENYVTNEIIIKQEMMRARGGIPSGDSTSWNPVTTEKDLELLRNNPSPYMNSVRRRQQKAEHAEEFETAEVMV